MSAFERGQCRREKMIAPTRASHSLECERRLWNDVCLHCRNSTPTQYEVVCRTCKRQFKEREESWKDTHYLRGGYHFCRTPGCWSHTMKRGSKSCFIHYDTGAESSPVLKVEHLPPPNRAVKTEARSRSRSRDAQSAPSPSLGYGGQSRAKSERSRSRSGSCCWSRSSSRSSSPSLARVTMMRPACSRKKVKQWVRNTCSDEELCELLAVCASEVNRRFGLNP